MITNVNVVLCFKLNLQNIMVSHLLNQSLRKKIYVEILNDTSIMKHLVEHHLDTFYIVILSSSILYALKDTKLSVFDKRLHSPDLKRFEIILLVLIYVLCRNVENAI